MELIQHIRQARNASAIYRIQMLNIKSRGKTFSSGIEFSDATFTESSLTIGYHWHLKESYAQMDLLEKNFAWFQTIMFVYVAKNDKETRDYLDYGYTIKHIYGKDSGHYQSIEITKNDFDEILKSIDHSTITQKIEFLKMVDELAAHFKFVLCQR
jgi:hypothetical protein